MRKILFFTGFLLLSLTTFGQDTIRVKNNVFEVLYSQKLEQPLWLKYRSTNRPTNVNRGTMDFYTEKNIKTSDGEAIGHDFGAESKVEILWKKGNEHPQHGFATYLTAVKVSERTEGYKSADEETNEFFA